MPGRNIGREGKKVRIEAAHQKQVHLTLGRAGAVEKIERKGDLV